MKEAILHMWRIALSSMIDSAEVSKMKKYKLKNKFKGCKKGTQFYLIAESEFIGVKEFVLRTQDLTVRISVSEDELKKNFYFLGFV